MNSREKLPFLLSFDKNISTLVQYIIGSFREGKIITKNKITHNIQIPFTLNQVLSIE